MKAQTKLVLKTILATTVVVLLLEGLGVVALCRSNAGGDYRHSDYEIIKRMYETDEGKLCSVSAVREYLSETGFSHAYVDLEAGPTIWMTEPSKELGPGVYSRYIDGCYLLLKHVDGECVLRCLHESAL